MKTQKVKEKFIELRAKGFSYNKISKQLKVSKQTLINWGRDFESNIKDLQEIELETLREKFLLLKKDRIRIFGKRLLAIDKELDRRKLADISTDKLMLLLLKIYEAFPEISKHKSKLTKEEEMQEKMHAGIDRWTRIITGEYETTKDQKLTDF